MKRIFVVDWILLSVFLLSAISGLYLHFVGHGWAHHGMRHTWEIVHIVASIAFLLAGIYHVKMHWGWYSGLVRSGLGKKSRITLFISIAFVGMALTGLVLLGMEGPKHGLGQWHYKLGLLSTALFLWHILKRLPVLRKSLNREVRR